MSDFEILSNTTVHWRALDVGRHPCHCCSALVALGGDYGGTWRCARTGQEWPVCDDSDYVRADGALLAAAMLRVNWADYTDAEEAAAWGLLTTAEQERREAAAAAERLETLATMDRDAEAYRARLQEEKAAAKAKRVKEDDVLPLPQRRFPCRNLYFLEDGPVDAYGRKPLARCISSECWGWEHVDPAKGEHVVTRTCPYIHPGQVGWHAEWANDREWRPSGVAGPVRQFGGGGGGGYAAPRHGAGGGRGCHNCGKEGHYVRDCRAPRGGGGGGGFGRGGYVAAPVAAKPQKAAPQKAAPKAGGFAALADSDEE